MCIHIAVEKSKVTDCRYVFTSTLEVSFQKLLKFAHLVFEGY